MYPLTRDSLRGMLSPLHFHHALFYCCKICMPHKGKGIHFLCLFVTAANASSVIVVPIRMGYAISVMVTPTHLQKNSTKILSTWMMQLCISAHPAAVVLVFVLPHLQNPMYILTARGILSGIYICNHQITQRCCNRRTVEEVVRRLHLPPCPNKHPELPTDPDQIVEIFFEELKAFQNPKQVPTV